MAVLVSLDVNGAFDAASWPSILKTLKEVNFQKNLYILAQGNSWFQAFAAFSMSCVTFCVFLRRMVFNSRRFRTLFLFNLHRPMKMEHTQCSETSAIKLHTPENNPKGYTRHSKRYFSERTATMSTNTIPMERDVSKGFPQGTYCGLSFGIFSSTHCSM
jgi:hypothetical protein